MQIDTIAEIQSLELPKEQRSEIVDFVWNFKLNQNVDEDVQQPSCDYRTVLEKYYHKEYLLQQWMVEPPNELRSNIFQQVDIRQAKFQLQQHHPKPIEQSVQRYSNYLIKYVPTDQSIFFSDQNTCFRHVITGDYSRHVAFDRCSGRYYMYENNRCEVVVRSVRIQDEICRFKSTVKRNQPVLYYLSRPAVLIIAGGYQPTKGKEVVGSDMMEIFKLERWKIDSQPVLMKLPTNRIAPIILEMHAERTLLSEKDLTHSQHQQFLLQCSDSIVVLGGHKYAELQLSNNKNTLKYGAYRTENQLNNRKAHAVPLAGIEQALSEKDIILKPMNLNVVFDGDFLQLHNHIIIQKQNHHEKQLLLLTQQQRDLYGVHFSNKVSNIIEIKLTGDTLSTKRRFSSEQTNRPSLSQSLVSLNTKGKLQITPIVKKQNKAHCTIF